MMSVSEFEVRGNERDLEALKRAIRLFLDSDDKLYDFDLHFDPPLILDHEELTEFAKEIFANDFDGFTITGFENRPFLVFLRKEPIPKRLVIETTKENVDGRTLYKIERAVGKTFT
jgi:hypothetical protein